MDALRHILPKVLEKRGLKGAAEAARCLTLADAWLKRRLPELALAMPWQVQHLKDGVLQIAVTHAMAGQEIALATPDLQAYLWAEIGLRPQIRVQRQRPGRENSLAKP